MTRFNLTDIQALDIEKQLSFTQHCRDMMFEKREMFKKSIMKWKSEARLVDFRLVDAEILRNLCVYVGLDDDFIAEAFSVSSSEVRESRRLFDVPGHYSAENGERTVIWLYDPKIFSEHDLEAQITVRKA